MTHTNTLRETVAGMKAAAHYQTEFHRGWNGALDAVAALIDAHVRNHAQPDIAGGAVSDQPACDAVAAAAKVLLRDYRALKTLTDYQLRHSSSASSRTIAARGKLIGDALTALAKGHQP